MKINLERSWRLVCFAKYFWIIRRYISKLSTVITLLKLVCSEEVSMFKKLARISFKGTIFVIQRIELCLGILLLCNISVIKIISQRFFASLTFLILMNGIHLIWMIRISHRHIRLFLNDLLYRNTLELDIFRLNFRFSNRIILLLIEKMWKKLGWGRIIYLHVR